MENKLAEPMTFRQSEILLIVPPFADIYQPSLACHLLQGIVRTKGFDVQVVYANVILAAIMGEDTYRRCMRESHPDLVMERIFGYFAYQMAPLTEEERAEVKPPEVLDLEHQIPQMLDHLEAIVRQVNPKIVGATSSYEQISTSVAILNRCKEINPEVMTIIGGANCEDEMADGIISLGGKIDHVFSGESEETFPAFLETVLRKGETPDKVLYGKPCNNMDVLPLPVYHEFFEQYKHLIPESSLRDEHMLAVPYETSRGCWWGQKHHCTFCGLNGGGMAFRKKKPEIALADFVELCSTYPVKRINVVDNIMPINYFKDLLPKMEGRMPQDLDIFYEQKANLSLEKVDLLQRARITRIQPGIEGLNSGLLKLMDKGIKGYQNLALLRYSRSAGIAVFWNLLVAFPGDKPEHYEEMLDLIPMITHLQPPNGDGPGHLRIDRFSPYFTKPEKYGITNLRPMQHYDYAFPKSADIFKLAYHFNADYHSGYKDKPELVGALRFKVNKWQEFWDPRKNPRPHLKVIEVMPGNFVLQDSRGLEGTEKIQFLTREQTMQILVGGTASDRPKLQWAIDRKLLVEMDNRLVPLAIAPMKLMHEVERENKTGKTIQERLAV